MHRSAAALLVATAALIALAPGPAIGQTIHTFPGCGPTLQACVDAAAAGDTIRVATAEPIDETVRIVRGLTLEAAPGSDALLGDSNIFADAVDPGGSVFVFRGLTFAAGRIAVDQESAGPLAVTVERNVFLGAVNDRPAIELDEGGDVASLGAVAFSIVDNAVTRPPRFEGSSSRGISVGFRRSAGVTGTLAGNAVDISGSRQGVAVSVRNATPSMRVDLDRNRVTGTGYHRAFHLENGTPGTAMAVRMTNNLASGQGGTSGAASALAVSAQDGTLDALVVNNTFAENRTTMDLRQGAEAVLSGLFASNVVARSQRGLAVGLDVAETFLLRSNLVFGNGSDTPPGPGSVLADPLLLGDGTFRPGPTSPVRDAGAAGVLPADRQIDLAGNPRVVGAAVDIGAFELPCASLDECSSAPGPEPDPDDPGPPPPGTCDPATCDDGDPCTRDECTPAGCVHKSREGFAGALCACERPDLEACAGDTVPRGVRRKASRACTLLARAAAASSTAKERRIVRRAAGLWTRAAGQAASRRVARRLSDGCVRALGEALGDAASRTARLAP